MVKLNKTCIACKTKYSYCPTCSRADALKPTWYSEFCSEPCKDIWTTATKYNMNMLTKDEAKAIISNIDLKPIDAYVSCIQKDYANIMAEDKKSRKVKKFEPVVVEEIAIEEIAEPVVIEPVEPIIAQPIEEVAPVAEPTVHEVVLKEEE